MAGIPFSRPSLGEEEISEVAETLRSGWITSGPRTKRFEEAFAACVGAPHAVAVTSGTAALHLALLAHGISPGDEVVTSALSWPSAANMIDRIGARAVFAEVDRSTLQVTPETVERVLTDRTRAVIPVHFAGQSCDLDGLREIARRRDLVLIEDAAHAVGTEYKGRRVGGTRNTACFSFHPIKNITTGEGGMVTTDLPDMAERLRRLRFHGVQKDAWSRYHKREVLEYESVEAGFKYNLTDIAAALGIHQLKKLDGFIERRTRLARTYQEELAGFSPVLPLGPAPGTTRHAWHLFVVTVEPSEAMDRGRLASFLGEKGIGTGLHFTAVHLHRHYREKYGYRRGALPETERAGDRVLSLPLFPDMKEEEVRTVCRAIRSAFDGEGA